MVAEAGPPALCKVCRASTRFLCTTFNEHGGVKEIHNRRCPACGLVFVSNGLTPADLAAAYATLDWDGYYREIREENLAKMRSACAAVRDLTGGDVTKAILDIGCGDGEFLRQVGRHGYKRLAGHEIPGADLQSLAEQGVAVYQDMDWGSIPTGAFDVVTMLDVAEHVMHPVELFRQCHRALRPGGRLYFHTPFVTKFDRLMHGVAGAPVLGKLGRVWQRGRTSIFHLQNYTERAVRMALEGVGFAECQVQRRNELSWPVTRYVRVYLCEKQRLPAALAPVLAPLFYPLLATDFFNSNKGIVTARK